jgi:regulator of sigma E protease
MAFQVSELDLRDLAAFNILPIPALDGGRVLFVLFELAKGKKVNASTEQLFHGLGFLALLCLMIFVTYFDIVKALADAAF